MARPATFCPSRHWLLDVGLFLEEQTLDSESLLRQLSPGQADRRQVLVPVPGNGREGKVPHVHTRDRETRMFDGPVQLPSRHSDLQH